MTQILTHPPPIRHFAQGESGEYFAIQNWLLKRGYELNCASHVYSIKDNATGHKTRYRNWSSVLIFIDAKRMEEGLEPLVRRS